MTFYDCRESEILTHNNIDDAVEEFLDATEATLWPRSLTVVAYHQRTVSDSYTKSLADWAMEHMLDLLDEEFGGEEYTDPTPTMKDAALAFARAVVSEYKPWRCERAPLEDVDVDVADWVCKHNPEWIEADPEVRKFVEEEG